ncbi:MAG: FAD-binding oxidoreductase [Ignavibacteriae bacterium]|nr:MAG: FAD-binding oxidoreductase [Ignavibacteriota bacterium]
MNPSFWEHDVWNQAASQPRSGFVHLTCDVAIIGGGIIGISTAIELKERHPDLHVVVIERSDPPRGASTRNAGFACFGSVSEIAHDIDLMGADQARDLVQRRLEGLHQLRSRCSGFDIGYEEHGGHEIFIDHHPSLDRIDEINTLLEPLFHGPAFAVRNDLIAAHGFSPRVATLVHTPYEGTLHSGLMVRGLWSLAQRLGVEIVVGEVVPRLTRNDSTTLPRSARNDSTPLPRSARNDSTALLLSTGEEITAQRVVLATNALFPESLLLESLATSRSASESLASSRPARGQVFVTAEIPGLRLRGSYHYDEGYVYFRNIGDRILLGGGRNLDIDGETTAEFETTPQIQTYLEGLLAEVIAPGHDVQIERRWAGIMGFRDDKQPFVGEIAPGVIQAFGCNGMGVAIGSTIARQAAELVTS